MGMKAILLDRDGTIIDDVGYLSNLDGVRLLPGTVAGFCRLRDAGYNFFIITNQSGISRGCYDVGMFLEVNNRMIMLLGQHGISICKTYYCPHVPGDRCCCRKPSAGMLLNAVDEYDVDPMRSWMIGDKVSDVQSGADAGMKTIRIGVPDPVVRDLIEPTHWAEDLAVAASHIIDDESQSD